MNHTLNYVIRSFDDKIGQIVVDVTCAEHEHTQTFAVDLPIKEDNTYPVGDELNALIASMAPVWHFERMTLTAGVTNTDAIRSLVVARPEPVTPIPDQVV